MTATPGRRGGIFRLPLPWVLALRYLKSTRRDAFATFLSWVATASIALGVAALILTLAVLSGFQRALKAQVLSRTPEIEISLPPAVDPEPVRQAVLAVEGVVAVHATISGQGWLLAGGSVQPALLVGFDGTVPREFPGAVGKASGVYVSESLAARWGVAEGSRVEIASSRPTLTPLGPQPRSRVLSVAGVFESNATDEKERVALPLAVAESLLGRERRTLRVETGGLEQALVVAPRLARALASPGLPPGLAVATWQELNRPLLFALALEKLATFVSIALVVLVAVLALVADLALIIASKRGEIGILEACGAPATAIERAFLILGLLLAGLGLAAGGVLGVGGALLLDRLQILKAPAEVFFIDAIPFWVRPVDVAAVAFFTLAVALASSLYAARRATLLTPVEAMRR